MTKTAGRSTRHPVRAVMAEKQAPALGWSMAPFYAALTVLLVAGWMQRHTRHLSAEEGLGYLLGIAGGSFMLLLLFYPLRKRIKVLRVLGGIKHWFRLHMILGVLGPVLILFHANFSLGSTNSNVALFSMLLVMGSGLVGRYLYSRLHRGLYGARLTLAELADQSTDNADRFKNLFARDRELIAHLEKYRLTALEPPTGVLDAWGRSAAMAIRVRLASPTLRRRVRRLVRDEAVEHGLTGFERRLRRREGLAALERYLLTMRRAAGLSFFERLFALWHVLHVPLFVMLVIAGFTHVIAVHLY